MSYFYKFLWILILAMVPVSGWSQGRGSIYRDGEVVIFLVDDDTDPGRIIRVIPKTLERGRPGYLSVEMNSLGNENALTFSLAFDPALISYVSTAKGPSAPPNMTLIRNDREAAQGRVGFLAGLGPGNTFTTGTFELVRLNLNILPGDGVVETPIRFETAPVPISFSHPSVTYLPGNFIGTNITLQGEPVPTPPPEPTPVAPTPYSATPEPGQVILRIDPLGATIPPNGSLTARVMITNPSETALTAVQTFVIVSENIQVVGGAGGIQTDPAWDLTMSRELGVNSIRLTLGSSNVGMTDREIVVATFSVQHLGGTLANLLFDRFNTFILDENGEEMDVLFQDGSYEIPESSPDPADGSVGADNTDDDDDGTRGTTIIGRAGAGEGSSDGGPGSPASRSGSSVGRSGPAGSTGGTGGRGPGDSGPSGGAPRLRVVAPPSVYKAPGPTSTPVPTDYPDPAEHYDIVYRRGGKVSSDQLRIDSDGIRILSGGKSSDTLRIKHKRGLKTAAPPIKEVRTGAGLARLWCDGPIDRLSVGGVLGRLSVRDGCAQFIEADGGLGSVRMAATTAVASLNTRVVVKADEDKSSKPGKIQLLGVRLIRLDAPSSDFRTMTLMTKILPDPQGAGKVLRVSGLGNPSSGFSGMSGNEPYVSARRLGRIIVNGAGLTAKSFEASFDRLRARYLRTAHSASGRKAVRAPISINRLVNPAKAMSLVTIGGDIGPGDYRIGGRVDRFESIQRVWGEIQTGGSIGAGAAGISSMGKGERLVLASGVDASIPECDITRVAAEGKIIGAFYAGALADDDKEGLTPTFRGRVKELSAPKTARVIGRIYMKKSPKGEFPTLPKKNGRLDVRVISEE